MGVVSSNFKSTVTFGGTVSSSLMRSTKTMETALGAIEREMGDLERQQQSLTQSIKKGKLSGKDVTGLAKDYAKVTKQIREAANEQKILNENLRLNRSFRRSEAFSKGKAGLWRMGAGTVTSAFTGGAGLLGLMGAGVGGALAVNSNTAEQAGLARSYGVSMNTLKAWDSIGKQMGMNGENIGDLAEELSNKIGEFKTLGKMSSVSDAFSGLGLTSRDLAGMSNEQQMAKVLNRALAVKDDQVARSMVDMLMGGEGNKILTWMRQSGKTYEQLMREQERYILTTKDGTDAAVRGNVALGRLWTSVGTASEEIIGTVLGELSPSIEKYADDLADWFKGDGKEKLVDGIMDFGSGLSDFWHNDLKPVTTELWKGLKILSEIVGNYFADYETKYSKAKSPEEVRILAIRQSMDLTEDSDLSYFERTNKASEYAMREMKRKEDDLKKEIKTREDLALGGDTRESRLNNLMDRTKISDMRRETNNNLTITVHASAGVDGKKVGEEVANNVFDILKKMDTDNGMWDTPSIEG